jgi:hypothetical protein
MTRQSARAHLDSTGKNGHGIAPVLCEILLQEAIKPNDAQSTFSELIICAFDELMYTDATRSRFAAYHLLGTVNELPQSKREIRRLADESGVLTHIARKQLTL